MLPKKEFDNLYKRFDFTEKLCTDKFKYYDEEVLTISDLSQNNEFKINDLVKLIDEMQLMYSNCLHEKDKHEMYSFIENKADKFDITRIEELKASKSDINSIAITIDLLHK